MQLSQAVRIVDGFYSDPLTVRDFALHCEYVNAWGSWSGLHSLERVPDTRKHLLRISALISDRLPNWEELDAAYQFWKKASCGGFATLFAGQDGVIHAHRRSGDWAGVVYLSEPHQCEGREGTVFYRHRATRLECYTDEEDPAFQRACADARNPEAWEVTQVISMRFNRLVLFDSHFFHGASPGFGTSIPDCRLIQVFNFTLVKEPA
jgi:hypothetical protein